VACASLGNKYSEEYVLSKAERDGGLYEQRKVLGEALGSWTCVAFCRACAPYAFTRQR
jgi:hypothetical protein